MNIILGFLLAVNITTFFLYGIDKYKAKKGQPTTSREQYQARLNIAEARRRKTIVKWRISETTLLTMAAIGGSIGAWGGMRLWHHKTMHKKFKYGIPIIIILQVALAVYLLTNID